ncbi:NXPE family member 1-like [Littorina saxatilis]|uniref:NXPE C-terminal domain-containing protein n=1 Tax=Littorina saxatilis TaxID=31220 RepID=A0AAN9AW67_9CAEN
MGVTRKSVVFVVVVTFVGLLTYSYHLELGFSLTTSMIATAPSPFTIHQCHPDLLATLLHDPHPLFETNEDYLMPYLRKEGIPAQNGAGMRRERLDPVERYLFRQPPTTDTRCLPEELNSTVRIISPRDRYTVGDTVQIRLDLYTGYGTPRHSGGDDVRIWLKSASGNSSAVAKVTDLNNGSYLADAVLKWPGVTLVRVSLTHPQEYLRELSKLFHTIHSLQWITDVFTNDDGITEKTLCFHFAPIPGFTKICNLTSRNGDRTWFCSHPVSEGLNCSHWRENKHMSYQSIDKTPIARMVRPFLSKLKNCCSNTSLALRLVPNNIKIHTTQSPSKNPPALPPCWARPPRDTWQSSAHTGWLNKWAWQSNTCSLPALTPERVQRCMRNTTLILLGDSNQRLWFDIITYRFAHCEMYKSSGPWHAPRLCQNFNLNSTLMFLSHALPFNVGRHADLVTIPLPRALDNVLHYATPGGKAVIVVHFYRHFTAFSVALYRQRVREARQTLQDFVQLHPNVKVIIRGPHAVYQSHMGTTMVGDASVSSYRDVWKKEFVGLEDKVWFLDLWDLSVAAENMFAHPVSVVDTEMVKLLFGYMCEGEA